MKLAYVYDAVYPWETGGVQKRVWELARRLADDHDVHWYGLQYWAGPSVIEREGVTLHGVAEPRALYVDGRRSIAEALYFSTHLLRPLRGGEFDVVDCQVFPYFSCYASRLSTRHTDAALLMTWHEVWREYWYEYLGWKGVFGRLIERGAVCLPDEHLSVSRRTQRELETLGGCESRLLPNGIDHAAITATPAADEPVDVLFVGRFIREKNPALLVRAVARLREEIPEVNCVLVGNGPERARVERLVDELDAGDYVTLLDFRESHEDVIALLKAADAFVLPSRREGFGITVLEALASGTPVVTIDHPGNAATELVAHDETGYVVEESPVAVADGVTRATTSIDPTACVEAAVDFDWDVIAERAESRYRAVLK